MHRRPFEPSFNFLKDQQYWISCISGIRCSTRSCQWQGRSHTECSETCLGQTVLDFKKNQLYIPNVLHSLLISPFILQSRNTRTRQQYFIFIYLRMRLLPTNHQVFKFDRQIRSSFCGRADENSWSVMNVTFLFPLLSIVYRILYTNTQAL